MQDLFVQLNKLPDEILLYIFKNLSHIEVLYCIKGVSKRLDRLVRDTIFTSNLTLMKFTANYHVLPLSDSILDQLCLQLLPTINDKIKWFNIESSSVERVLLATIYPNLYGLSVYNMNVQNTRHLFTDNIVLNEILKNQISALTVHIKQNTSRALETDPNTIIFTFLFSVFMNLRYFNFFPSLTSSQWFSFDFSPPTIISSNLSELRVQVFCFSDCLYLLDGRFNQLHTLYIKIQWIQPSSLIIDNTKNIMNLKCFSLSCDNDTRFYDQLILPLLHRMLNLEKLDLHLVVYDRKIFIDGNDLRKNILNKMRRLSNFQFNIHSSIYLSDQIDFLSNDDIQYTFDGFPINKIISYVDYLPEIEKGQCHIYSSPYRLKQYNKITNHFPGGLFRCVREVSLFDQRPFEHEFFLRIQQSFPLLERLSVMNEKPQNNKQSRKSENDIQYVSIIEYSHLTDLILNEVHADYIEQFLLNTKTRLGKEIFLSVDYQSLKRVTNSFTRNRTELNCTKLRSLAIVDKKRIPKYVKEYFFPTKVF